MINFPSFIVAILTSLFTFYWNNRHFDRGTRQGVNPAEIISGQKSESDWVELILDKFPFEKLHRRSKPSEQKENQAA
jgi:hypothetical protein